MKKSIFIPIFLVFIFSCSPDEETSAPTNTIQTKTPEPETVAVQYTLTVSAGLGGSITGGGTFNEGKEVTVTAIPNEGYRFTGWEGNSSTNQSLTITINSNQTYKALFELITYTLTLTACEGGTVSSEGGTYEGGTEVSVTANPTSGYQFLKWSNESQESTISLTVSQNLELEAIFIYEALSLTGRDKYKFYYNFGENLPQQWVNEFRLIMGNLNSTVHITTRDRVSLKDGKSGMNIFAWNSIEGLPFQSEIGNAGGTCICGNEFVRYKLLEMPNDEFIYEYIHRYSVIAYEYFHVYQINASIVEPPYLKYLMEGGAATFEALYLQQYYSFNYFTNDQKNTTDLATNSPAFFETFNDQGIEINYANSVFIFLTLVKELQKRGDTEIQAFKRVYIDWWKSGRINVNKETLFLEVFGFSISDFYESIGSYSADINAVLPSESVRLQDIFTD